MGFFNSGMIIWSSVTYHEIGKWWSCFNFSSKMCGNILSWCLLKLLKHIERHAPYNITSIYLYGDGYMINWSELSEEPAMPSERVAWEILSSFLMQRFHSKGTPILFKIQVAWHRIKRKKNPSFSVHVIFIPLLVMHSRNGCGSFPRVEQAVILV